MTLIKVTSVLAFTLSVASCARFEERTHAGGEFEYQDATLASEYNSGTFTRDEQRSTYQIPELTDQQKEFGLTGIEVDVRPPTQLMAVIEGVSLDINTTHTKVWFNAFKENEKMEQKVWNLILRYLAVNNATSVELDRTALMIKTGPIVNFTDHGRNEVKEEAQYDLSIQEAEDGRSASLTVDVKKYQQINDGNTVKQILAARTKKSVELGFVNDLLAFSYNHDETKQLQSSGNKQLPIKLGFDDNYQTAWIVDSTFITVWEKLPELLETMSFEIIQDNKNLGYFLVDFIPQNDNYWAENKLNPITLESEKYFAQLGELSSGQTSIIWLNEDKKPLSDQQVTDLYLSITETLRSVELNN